MPNWKKRIVFGSLILATLVGLTAADAHLSRFADAASGLTALFCQGSILTFLIAGMSVVGSREACRLVRAAGHRPIGPLVQLTVLALIIWPWLAQSGIWESESTRDFELRDWQGTGIILSLSMLLVGVLAMTRPNIEGAIGHLGSSYLIILYLGFLAGFTVRLRLALPGPEGAWALVSVFLVVKSADIGAYAAGKWFGRLKTVPSISPNKTREGFVGGGLLAMGVAVAVSYAWPQFSDLPCPWADGLWQTLAFGLVMSVAGQLGDLFESLLKRDASIKDSGAVPVFGGILDMMDSPLFAAPVAWWWLTNL